MFKKTYFLLAPQLKLVKIGCSEHPLARMMSLRTMNAAETEPLFITETPEHELHEEFADYRDHGEWFKVSWVMYTYFKTHIVFHDLNQYRKNCSGGQTFVIRVRLN